MLFGLFLTLGVAVLSVALRSFQTSFAQKLGALGILIATFLAFYFITGNMGGVLRGEQVGCSCRGWRFSPVFAHCVCRKRSGCDPRLRLRPVCFPRSTTSAVKSKTKVLPTLMTPAGTGRTTGQFFRLFYRTDDRAQATICLNEQHDLSFYYLRISSRAKNGLIWTTWNYPLSYGLKLTPQFRINRQRPDQSFWQLYQSHREFLKSHSVETASLDSLDDERIQTDIENDLRDQIAHNVRAGVLKAAANDEVKYSWRGMIYLWCQFLLDLVRL
jgi:hypothetical protein